MDSSISGAMLTPPKPHPAVFASAHASIQFTASATTAANGGTEGTEKSSRLPPEWSTASRSAPTRSFMSGARSPQSPSDDPSVIMKELHWKAAAASPPTVHTAIGGRDVIVLSTGGLNLPASSSPVSFGGSRSSCASPPLIPRLPPVAPHVMHAPPLPSAQSSAQPDSSGCRHNPAPFPPTAPTPHRASDPTRDPESQDVDSDVDSPRERFSPSSPPLTAHALQSPSQSQHRLVMSHSPPPRQHAAVPFHSSPLSGSAPLRSPARRASFNGTPTKSFQSPPASASPSTATPSSPGFVSPSKLAEMSSPPAGEAMLLLRKIVDLYCKSVDTKASMDASVQTLSPTARSDILHRILSSSSWVGVALTMIQRARALFAECFGEVHASAAGALKLQGLLHAQVGQYTAAVEVFQHTLMLCEHPAVGVDVATAAGVRYNLGMCLLSLADYAAAVSCFRRVLPVYAAIHGESHQITQQVHEKLAQASRSGMQEQYTKLFSSALKAQADSRHSDAHAAFEKCLELLPNDPETAYSICTCCCKIGCCEGGMSWFRLAVEWGYCDWEAANNDPDLGNLHLHPEFNDIIAAGLADASDCSDDDCQAAYDECHSPSKADSDVEVD